MAEGIHTMIELKHSLHQPLMNALHKLIVGIGAMEEIQTKSERSAIFRFSDGATLSGPPLKMVKTDFNLVDHDFADVAGVPALAREDGHL